MSSESDVQLVQRSFEMILPMADTFAAMFYDRFFTAVPEARPLFKTEMALQRQKVMEMLSLTVHHLDDPESMQHELRELGGRHVNYHVEVRHYAVMNKAILGALADCLGEQFTPEMNAAWQSALDSLAESMIVGHT
jgi:hemoglobin-like flavoprotein